MKVNDAGSKRRVEVDKEVMDKRSGILLMDGFWPFFYVVWRVGIWEVLRHSGPRTKFRIKFN